jgi:hypothetical protein
MNVRKALPITTVLLILALALATVGVGYGLWSKTLFIEGAVHTGEVDAVMSLAEVDQSSDFNDNCATGGSTIGKDCDEDGFLNDDLEAVDPLTGEPKDIAECVAYLDQDPQILHVEVENGYPSFNCFVRWDAHNTGTVPIDLYGPAYFYEGVFQGSAINNAALHVNGWPPSCYSSAWDEYVQVDQNESVFCNLHVHVNQGAAELADYAFEVRIWGRQWNEIVAPPWP